MVDVAALARKAVADGADLLGVAGGDGTQALVAGIAAEHDLPFLVISAGTRNHFALDLGLDREDPATCLDALTDGEELQVDLGVIADRTFVNNASFGAYAEVVRSPAYRDDKRGTTLQLLPGPAPRPPRSPADRPGRCHHDPGPAGPAGQQRPVRDERPRRPRPARPAGRRHAGRGRRQGGQRPAGRRAARRGHGPGLTVLTAGEVTIDADTPRSRSASTARRSCCPPRSAAPSSPGRSGWSYRDNGPAFPPPRRPWNGRGCGSSRPSAPGQAVSPSPPGQAGSQARKHGRRRRAASAPADALACPAHACCGSSPESGRWLPRPGEERADGHDQARGRTASRDQGDARSSGEQGPEVGEVDVRAGERREPRGQRPDEADAVIGQAEDRCRDNRGHDHDEHGRDLRQPSLQHQVQRDPAIRPRPRRRSPRRGPGPGRTR